MNYPFVEINTFQNDWNTTYEKRVVSTHPPLEEVTIKVQNSEIIVSLFKKINPKEYENRNANLKDIKSLQQQNNFINQILGTIASQMDRIEKNFPISITRVDYDEPLFKPLEINKPLKFSNKNNELIENISQKARSC